MIWSLALLPMVAGAAIWLRQPAFARRRHQPAEDDHRRLLLVLATLALGPTLLLALWAAAANPSSTIRWGAGLELVAHPDGAAQIVAVLVPAVALPIVAYATAHEPPHGLTRLVALLVAFVGAMELLVVAGDLLTLLMGWELVGAISWALIGHGWRDADKPSAAAHAFNATRFGDLGLFLAAGAAFTAGESLAFADLGELHGATLHVFVAGVLVAAVAKSGQVPFSPWLFSAMGGPTPVSALLHAATMVAAGAYLLIRLHPVLDAASWFAPVTIAVGLTTALAGGVVAILQPHAKKLLAASTSAHYGLMFVAVGAGYPVVAGAHLVAHAVFKALLFLTAGVAMSAVGTGLLGRMRLGRLLPTTAVASFVGALALAAVPPLGAAWTKEEVVAAAGHHAGWLAVVVVVAGGMSAFYGLRYHLAAFGRLQGSDDRQIHRPGTVEHAALAALGVGTVLLGVLWIPAAEHTVTGWFGGELPAGKPWEVVASITVAAGALYAAAIADRRGKLVTAGLPTSARTGAADWLGLPAATRRLVVDPTLALAAAAARFDDRVVDAGVRGAAAVGRAASRLLSTLGERGVDGIVEALARATVATAGAGRVADDSGVDGSVEALATGVGHAGRDSRRLQTGMTHHYYVIVAVGTVLVLAVAAIWR